MAKLVELSVEKTLGKSYRTKDIMQPGKIEVSTTEMGELISKEIISLSNNFKYDI